MRKYVTILNLEGVSVNKAFLFGSYSKDTASESSDINVMIVSDKHDENDDMIIGKIWKLTRNINIKIEPFLSDIENLEKTIRLL